MCRHLLLLVFLFVSVLFLQSCSGDKTKNSEQAVSSSAREQQRTGIPENAAAAPAATRQRPPAELLAAIPCKLAGKPGVFAAFPDNLAAGQGCFSLYPAQGTEPNIPKFDIQNGGIYVILHNISGSDTGDIKLIKWEERGGSPCLEAECGAEIPARSELYSSPNEAGWNYVIVEPTIPVDLASETGGYYGIVKGSDKYFPLFQ